MPLVRKPNSPFFWYDFRFRGRRYRGSTKETVKAAARAFESQLMMQLEESDTLPSRGRKAPLLRDLLPQFLKSFEQNQLRAKETKRYYNNGARLLLDTPLKEFPIDRLTTSTVAAVSFPHSAYTGNNAIRTLRRALAYAVELGYLRTVPRMHLYRETAREQLMTPEFEARILSVASPVLSDVFTILMDTGMRPEEVYRMTWEGVDWAANLYRVDGGKTAAASRSIGMSLRVRDILTRRVKETGESPFVFPSRKKGKHIYSVNKAFAKARKDAGLPKSLVLYSTRHTFGTDVMEATGSSKLTMKSMGHSDVKTSARYQHPETNRIASVIDARNAGRKSVTALENGHTSGHTTEVLQ